MLLLTSTIVFTVRTYSTIGEELSEIKSKKKDKTRWIKDKKCR